MRIGIIGAGSIANLRKRAIDDTADAFFAGVFDINSAKAHALAEGGKIYDNADALISDPEIDAVVICTPPDSHEDIATTALNAGKHVIVEKPMANSLEGCRRMLDKSRESQRILTVGFNHRYFPAIKELKAAIRSGAIGRLSYVRGFTGHTGLSEFKSPWMYSKDVMGGGTLFDNGIHLIDLVQYIMGGVTSVYGQTTNDIWNLDRVEENAFAILTGKDNVIGTLHSSWTEWKGYHFCVEAYGDRGMARAFYAPMQYCLITMEKPGGRSIRKRNFYIPSIIREKIYGWEYTAAKTLSEEIADFISLADGKETTGPIARAEDGYRSIEIANSIYQSNENNCSVPLCQSI